MDRNNLEKINETFKKINKIKDLIDELGISLEFVIDDRFSHTAVIRWAKAEIAYINFECRISFAENGYRFSSDYLLDKLEKCLIDSLSEEEMKEFFSLKIKEKGLKFLKGLL